MCLNSNEMYHNEIIRKFSNIELVDLLEDSNLFNSICLQHYGGDMQSLYQDLSSEVEQRFKEMVKEDSFSDHNDDHSDIDWPW